MEDTDHLRYSKKSPSVGKRFNKKFYMEIENENLEFGENASDKDLVTIIDLWVKESQPWHDVMLSAQNKSVQYYLGEQTEKKEIPEYNSDTVINRIFEATETVVPIVAGTAHRFIAIPAEDNEKSLARARTHQKVLSRKYSDLGLTEKLRDVTRDMILKRFGVAKWYWNYSKDDIDVKVIDPRLILIPKMRCKAKELPYKIEIQGYDKDELETFFPKIKADDISKSKTISTTRGVEDDLKDYQVLEVWTSEYVAWKAGDQILKRMVNPYYDWTGIEEERKIDTPTGKVKTKKFKKFSNFLDRPRDPFVFFAPFTTGDAPVSETCLAEISIPIQDDINVQKRAIVNNLVKMGNGQILMDAGVMSEETRNSITSEAGLIIEGKNLVSENRFRREAGLPLPNSHFQNLQHSISSFDSVFGVHGSVRGASESDTLGGQIMDRQQGLSRIQQLTDVINEGVAEMVDGLTQLMKMFYTEDHVIKILGKNEAVEFVKHNQDSIEQGMIIDVKDGRPNSLDPIQRSNQAIQLWQLGAIDPITFFERLEFPDPVEIAQKLLAWKRGELLMESQIRQQENAASTEAKAKVDKESRAVENEQTMIERAQESLGGGAAPLQQPTNEGK